MDELPQTNDPILAPALEALRRSFGHEAFRSGQEAALRSILAGRNVVAVMPTGSGKSLLFQLPALLVDGLTLVVSPLIALMKDQVDELARRKIPASFINSSLSLREQQDRIQQCLRGEVRLLYVAPERFRSENFLGMLRNVKVSRMAVDEAHCISEWGHDFRPDYRRLREFRGRINNPPVTALTATATPRVRQDIIESLGLRADEVDVHVHGFDRPNLALRVVEAHDADSKNAWIRQFVRQQTGPGIIYVGTRQVADDLADIVRLVEPRTVTYHAGLEAEERSRAQDEFLGGKARIAVATMAFGMGIDKADVRFVVHYHYPASVEQYYQEIGRAGRDGLPSQCVLLYAPADRNLREFFIDLSYPTREQVRSVYQALMDIPANPILMTYREIADQCDEKLKDGQVGAAVRLLDAAGVTRALTDEPAAWVTLARPGAEILPGLRGQTQRKVFEALASVFDLETPGRYQVELWQLGSASGLSDDQVRRALAALGEAGHLQYEPPPRGRGVEKLVAPPPPFAKVPVDWQRHEMRRGIEEEKLSGIERYISGPTCRRKAILQYFGEQNGAACGICDRCRKPPQPSAGRSSGDVLASWPDVAGPVLVCLRHLRFPVGVGRIAQVVTGSRDSELLSWKLDKNPAYGSVRAKQETVKRVIENLRTEGYLKREGEDPRRPVLALTARGKAAAEAVEKGGSATPAPPKSPKPASLTKATILAKMAKAFESPGSSSAPASSAKPERSLELVPERPMATTKKPSPTAITDAGRFLDELVRAVLAAKADEAESLVEKLRVFHPREVVPRLEASAVGGDAQVRGRAAWVVGELCEAQGLAFLIRSAIDKEANVRRLAASALGKVASRRRGAEAEEQQHWAMARLALQVLLNDAAPQVRQYAQKSLAAFPAEATPGHKA